MSERTKRETGTVSVPESTEAPRRLRFEFNKFDGPSPLHPRQRASYLRRTRCSRRRERAGVPTCAPALPTLLPRSRALYGSRRHVRAPRPRRVQRQNGFFFSVYPRFSRTVLVPVRASPVPSIVRARFVVKFVFSGLRSFGRAPARGAVDTRRGVYTFSCKIL